MAIIALFTGTGYGQGGTWVWMRGDSAANNRGNYGAQGVAAASNNPPALYEAASWTDLQGNFWIFGGVDSFNDGQEYSDLWKFDPVNNLWTWISGPGTPNMAGTFGVQGIPSVLNNPPSRGYGSLTWTDLNGDLWLLGGQDQFADIYSDLWRYQISTNEWTWMNGTPGIWDTAVYGIQQQTSALSTPGGRCESTSAWTDDNGNLWFFGGLGNIWLLGSPQPFLSDDMWKYNPLINQWTWMKGNRGQSYGSYGTKGVENVSNSPPARTSYTSWKDKANDFYIFGGAQGFFPAYNDVWKYNTTTNNWTWIAGDSTTDAAGAYLLQCSANGLNEPMARFENRTSPMGNCNSVFLSFGGYILHNQSIAFSLNDLWLFDAPNNSWKWLSGGDTLDGTGQYGSIGVASSSNLPPPRGGQCQWTDKVGNLWIFGGSGGPQVSYYNDVWKFIPDTTCTGAGLSWGNGFNFQIQNTSLCRGDSALFSVTQGSLTISPTSSITWLDSTHAQLHPDTTTTYFLTGTGTCGGLDTTQLTLNVGSPPIVAITASDTLICSNDSSLICTTDSFSLYHWSNGTANPCIETNTGGNYYVTVTDNNGCSAESNHIHIDVRQASQVSISQNGDTLRVYNALSQQWYRDGVAITNATANLYVAKQGGSYTVVVTDSAGCTESSNALVLGLNNVEEDRIEVYPNPLSEGNWQVLVSENLIGAELQVFDDNGKLVFHSEIRTPHSELNLDVARGVYFLRISSSTASVVRKLVRL